MSAVTKVISGGQTGVDRAALEVAIAVGIAHGGWCPLGRLAADGVVPSRYHLKETSTSDYAQRTELNVLDSDATLVLYRRELTGGTRLTVQLARRHGKPLQLWDLEENIDEAVDTIRAWLCQAHVTTLNVAGPRESHAPGIAEQSFAALLKVLV